jgi:hypothetical protein
MSVLSVSASINILPSGDASAAAIRILPGPRRSLGGILEEMEPVGGGLIRVVVSGREYLVDDILQEKLSDLMGQQVTICRVFGHWGAGAIPE